ARASTAAISQRRTDATGPLRVVLCATSSRSLLIFRGQLIRRLLDGGSQVVTVAADEEPGVRTTLEQWGAGFRCLPLRRSAVTPMADWRFVTTLSEWFDEIGPD